MKCEHIDVVPVFEQSAICADCGLPVCRHCRRPSRQPHLPVDSFCSVFYWKRLVETNKWHGCALSHEDAYKALNSATLMCRYHAGSPLYASS